jgi:hypothetical protein
VSGSLSAAAHQAGSLVAATGHLMASVGTRTCALRRGRRVRPEDQEGATSAVAAQSATRAEDGLDEVVAHPAVVVPEVEPAEVSSVDASTAMPPEEAQEEVQEPAEESVVEEPVAEVVPIVVTLDESFSSVPLAPSSTASFKSVRSSVSSTASISTLMRAMPAKKFVVRSALESDSDSEGSAGSSDTFSEGED